METRRDFLKKSALLAAGSGLIGALPAALQRAFAIDPPAGSTYLDAEHVVILMQENRSFDHAFGCLAGVRGFHDPRARTLPDGNPVWLQSNAAGETYGPFRLNIKDTRITWMGCLPHWRESQVIARNGGAHDRWLDAKPSGQKAYAHMPLTMGHYNREDIPFYYALADAFTICDQNFCSVLSCTDPNRLYLWTGTSHAVLDNDIVDWEKPANWTTFPERLEAAGISWRVYQNEIGLDTGLGDEENVWLANFGCNPLEFFSQYNVRCAPRHRQSLEAALHQLQTEPIKTKGQLAELAQLIAAMARLGDQSLDKLTESERRLHRNAFTTNEGDPDFRSLVEMTYEDGATRRTTQVPKGDVLHQFREDVKTGRLPTVSWLTAPERFSDHPSSPWYGAWYLSEVFDILTSNPDVWRKTIFVVCYDENDGYFDHVPPFMAPHPDKPETGKVSLGIDTAIEQVSAGEAKRDPDSIGLGFRVPLIVASPWTRGGHVCSQVFDHTSILQFLEKFLTAKTGQTITEPNITAWRRTVCGDLTSVFRPYQGEKIDLPAPVNREEFLDTISRAKFRPPPGNYKAWSAEEIAAAAVQPGRAPWVPQQEPGTRPSCPLPYELAVDAVRSGDGQTVSINMSAGKQRFGAASAGAPFQVYAQHSGRTWNYAVSAGDSVTDQWPLSDFPVGGYHLQVQGPNGLHREFRGTSSDPAVIVALQPDGRLLLHNHGPAREVNVTIEDLAYGGIPWTHPVPLGASARITMDLAKSGGWYDFRVRIKESPGFECHYAGRIETGAESISDPQMGRA